MFQARIPRSETPGPVAKSILSRAIREFFSRNVPHLDQSLGQPPDPQEQQHPVVVPTRRLRTISIFGAKGTWTQLTSWRMGSRQGNRAGRETRRVYFTGKRETPLEQHAYGLDFANPRNIKLLTESGWWNTATMDDSAHRMIVTRSNTQQPQQVYLADASGRRLFWVEENRLDADHRLRALSRTSRKDHLLGPSPPPDGSLLYFKILAPPPAAGSPVPRLHVSLRRPRRRSSGRQSLGWSARTIPRLTRMDSVCDRQPRHAPKEAKPSRTGSTTIWAM